MSEPEDDEVRSTTSWPQRFQNASEAGFFAAQFKHGRSDHLPKIPQAVKANRALPNKRWVVLNPGPPAVYLSWSQAEARVRGSVSGSCAPGTLFVAWASESEARSYFESYEATCVAITAA